MEKAERTFLLKGLDCPVCAGRIETEARTLSGVSSATLNLLSETLVLSLDDEDSGNLLTAVKNIVARHEPDVVVTSAAPETGRAPEETPSAKSEIIPLLIGALVYAAGLLLSSMPDAHPLNASVGTGVLVIAYLILGGGVLAHAVKNIVSGQILDENFLMSLSTLGAFAIGEYPEAVAVMLFYQIGELFQNSAVRRSKKSIADLMNIRPDTATVERDGKLSVVAPETVAVGERIVIKPGEKIPLDGVVLEGSSTLDTRALTGESLPKTVEKGDTVLSGCVNQGGVLTLEVARAFEDSAVARILDMVRNAESRKAPVENFITTFSRYYTPAVVALAAALAILPPLVAGGRWADWMYRALVFLVISCPCALVISIPLGFFGGIGGASRKGILVKGGNYLDALGKLDIIVFDKTGTLTQGVFKVTEILPAPGFSEEEVLEYAAYAESFSNHPIALSLREAYGKPLDQDRVSDYREHAGHGVSVRLRGQTLLAGNARFLKNAGISFEAGEAAGTLLYVALDSRLVGRLVIADEIKPDSKATLEALKKLGVRKTILLTGDHARVGKAVSEALGLDEYHAELLPDQKVDMLETLEKQKRSGKTLAFVGDGINDAPVIARADVGIAMGGLGSDAAIEAADVVLMTGEPARLVDAISIARATRRIVFQNIVCALGIKGAFLVLGALGVAGMWEAVFADTGVAVFAILNALRVLKA